MLSALLVGAEAPMGFLDALPIVGTGFLACLVCGALGGLLGVHVVLRRIVFASVAIAQVSSLGLALSLCIPAVAAGVVQSGGAPSMLGIPGLAAVVAALLAAALLARGHRERKLTREAVLGIAYALPSGLTLLILDHMAGESHMVENVLFGNTVFVPWDQLGALGVVALVVAVVHFFQGRRYLVRTFDADFAAAAGIAGPREDLAFYLLLAVALAFMIGSIGVMPVFGLMVMPAAAGLLLANRAPAVIAWAMGLGVAAAAGGFYLSFVFDLPTGPLILATAGVFLVPAAVWASLKA